MNNDMSKPAVSDVTSLAVALQESDLTPSVADVLAKIRASGQDPYQFSLGGVETSPGTWAVTLNTKARPKA